MTENAMTPAEEIRAAAARLREAAEGTTPGPWFVGDCEIYPRWILSAGKVDESGHPEYVVKMARDEADEVPISDADWRWMAFAHPGVAEPLAAWLEAAADEYLTPYSTDCPAAYAALAVARAINGAASQNPSDPAVVSR